MTEQAGHDEEAAKLLHHTKQTNEQWRLTAGALDRIATVVLGGAPLEPLFQHQALHWVEADACWGSNRPTYCGTAHPAPDPGEGLTP